MGYGKMANRYNSHKDLSDRLDGTICRYKNEPVFVRVESARSLALFELSTMSYSGEIVANIRPNDPEFDISSPELGYFNNTRYNPKLQTHDFVDVRYMIRNPVRRYKQGLNDHCVSGYRINGVEIGSSGALYTKGFKESLMDEFPSVSQAMAMLDDGSRQEVAVSQAIALTRISSGLTLVYIRMANVGWILPGKTDVMLKQTDYTWVYERILSAVDWRV